MDVDGELDHFVGRDALVLIFGVGQPCIGKTERAVNLLGRHGRVGRMNHDEGIAQWLDEALRVEPVALLLDVLEVFGVCLAVGQALLMAVQHDIFGPYALRNIFAPL